MKNFYSNDDLSLINPLVLIQTILKLRANPLVPHELKIIDQFASDEEIIPRILKKEQKTCSKTNKYKNVCSKKRKLDIEKESFARKRNLINGKENSSNDKGNIFGFIKIMK